MDDIFDDVYNNNCFVAPFKLWALFSNEIFAIIIAFNTSCTNDAQSHLSSRLKIYDHSSSCCSFYSFSTSFGKDNKMIVLSCDHINRAIHRRDTHIFRDTDLEVIVSIFNS